MSVSTPKKSLQRDNPFLSASVPVIRSLEPLAPTLTPVVPASPQPVAPRSIIPATIQWKKKQAAIKWRTTAGILTAAVVGFALLPVQTQQQLFQHIGLGSVTTQISSSIPLPVAYDYVSSPFGQRWGRQHQGIDLAAQTGAPIYAASAGTVIHSGWEAGYGNSVVIDHGQGRLTRYGHCSKVLIKEGSTVQKGQLIAKVGSTGHSTGPHLHFEVIVDGIRRNPAWYYRFDKAPQWYALREFKNTENNNWLRAFSMKLTRWLKS